MRPSAIASLFILLAIFTSASARTWKRPPERTGFPGFVEREVLAAKRLPSDVQDWYRRVLARDFVRAAELFPLIRPHVPESMAATTEATELYVLNQNGLAQIFVDQWLAHLSEGVFARSKAEAALESEISPNFENWLWRNPVMINGKSRKTIGKLSDEKHFALVLKALDASHDAARAKALLPKLGPTNWQSHGLANTVVFKAAQSKDLRLAANILKTYVEPSILIHHDLEQLAAKDLNVARLLYQAGKIQAAKEYYLRIPNTSKAYLQAREELAWVYLRLGDTSHLRGEVATLTSPVFEDRFSPESYVVRAVSNLKMCFYDKLEKDLSDFKRVNTLWIGKIEHAEADVNPKVPADADESIAWAKRVTTQLESELKALGRLKIARSTVKPNYWVINQTNLEADLAEAGKREAAEAHRFWRNRRKELGEAIKKMRFVKTEYMSQLMELAQRKQNVPPNGALLAANDVNNKNSLVDPGEANQILFPVDSEIWPDELFRIRSTAQMNCLKNGGSN